MALSKKEYSEMMKYLTRPATSSAQLGARAGTRAGFKEGTKFKEETEFKEETKLSDYIKPNVYANTTSSNQGGVKVDNKTISAVINLNIPLTKKLKIISDINAGASKTKVDLSELGKKYGVDLGTETYRDKNLNVGVGGEYTFDSGAKLRAMIDPENKSGQISIGMPFQKGGRAGFKEGTTPEKINPQKTKMILDMLRRGADVDTISTITGATVEEINKIAMTAKPISTNEPNAPEEQLSRNKTYSEIDILSNIDAKKPNSATKENITIYPMPELNPKTDNYMPEFYGMDNPKDVARYRKVPLKKGGRPIDTPADVAVEKSLFNPKTYGKYAKQIAKMTGTGASKLLGGLGSLAGIASYETGLLSDAEKALFDTDYLGRENTIKGQSESGRSALDIATDPLNYVELPFMSAVSGIITNPTAQKLLNLGIPVKYIKAAGPAGLAAMGIASLIDLARKSQKEFDEMSPEKQAKYLREQEEFAESVNREQFGSDD
jgi:hypothetical protein